MPKHKLNLNAGEETVPIDDTGPEVDVDVDEEPSLPIEPQQPDKPILGDEGGAEAVPEVEIEEVAQTDEHQEYSKNVKKRIDKLTGKLRESERREQAATEYAKNVYTENQNLQQAKQNMDGNYIISEANRITAETEATKNILRKANEEADTNAQVNAQQKLAALAVEAQRVQALNQERNVRQDWAEENSWFGNDRAMTMTSFVIHQDLLNEGFDATSNEYYDEVNKRIRTEFPHKFEGKTQANRPAQAVASAKRSAKSGRKTVRLTPSQVTIAKKLGVPLEEYAKYVE